MSASELSRPDRLAVFLDYQNVHLVGHNLFAVAGGSVRDSLLHPLDLSRRIRDHRKSPAELVSVRVFRGRPNPNKQPTLTAANDAQTASWERDPRVRVMRRDLNYRGWPTVPPTEKGVDVALAVDLIESALLEQYDVAVVFSGDTDLLPALEVAFRRTPPRIEIACWRGAKPLWFPEALATRPSRYLPYCHFLDRDDFLAARDATVYREP